MTSIVFADLDVASCVYMSVCLPKTVTDMMPE